MIKEIKSLNSLIGLETETLNSLKKKLSEQIEILPILKQRMELNQETLKQDLRKKMILYKTNIENILSNRTKELTTLNQQQQYHQTMLNMKLQIYEKRYYLLYEKLKDIEKAEAEVFNLLQTKLEGLKRIWKKMSIINDGLKSINHVDEEITFQYILKEVLSNRLDFNNKDYDYLMTKINVK